MSSFRTKGNHSCTGKFTRCSGTPCELSSTRVVALRPKRRHGRQRVALLDGASSSEPARLWRFRATAPIGFSETWFCGLASRRGGCRSEEDTSELQSRQYLVC